MLSNCIFVIVFADKLSKPHVEEITDNPQLTKSRYFMITLIVTGIITEENKRCITHHTMPLEIRIIPS